MTFSSIENICQKNKKIKNKNLFKLLLFVFKFHLTSAPYLVYPRKGPKRVAWHF